MTMEKKQVKKSTKSNKMDELAIQIKKLKYEIETIQGDLKIIKSRLGL
tara:strand:+ start:415 stop:558 length:144 start_codon:yes stop_codon:yes gene_type:complete